MSSLRYPNPVAFRRRAVVTLLAAPVLCAHVLLAQATDSGGSPPASPGAASRVPTAAEMKKAAAVGEPSRASTAAGAASSDTALVLSPFEVRPEEDEGYQATSTLAGTRLRSEMKDLAASISVVTKDFMNDVNATDLTSLLVYTLGTEVGGYGGNFSDLGNPEAQGVFDDALGQASPGTRIRGLIGADRTRNYFRTDVPMDAYNNERVEINRGANANLFGLGSPSGILNSGIISAGRPRLLGDRDPERLPGRQSASHALHARTDDHRPARVRFLPRDDGRPDEIRVVRVDDEQRHARTHLFRALPRPRSRLRSAADGQRLHVAFPLRGESRHQRAVAQRRAESELPPAREPRQRLQARLQRGPRCLARHRLLRVRLSQARIELALELSRPPSAARHLYR